MAKITTETTVITCPDCGGDRFCLTEKFQSGKPLFANSLIQKATLKSTLICDACGARSTVFDTSILFAGNASDDKSKPTEKHCPICSGDSFTAKIINRCQLPPKALFNVVFQEITHQVKCAGPRCPWKIQAIARSIWSHKVDTDIKVRE